MKITVSPKWTFIEALQAAWEAYSGAGPQYGAANRHRILDQWANVVGKDRAVAELEQALKEHGDLKTASKEWGLSIDAIKKLRKSFNKMPSVTPHARPPSTLHGLLKRIPEMKGEQGIVYSIKILPQLAALLGYGESELYFESAVGANARVQCDAVLAPYGPVLPHIIVLIKSYEVKGRSLEDELELIAQSRELAGASLGLLLSPSYLAIVREGPTRTYDLTQITTTEAEEISLVLQRPESVKAIKGASNGTNQLEALLNRVATASTNDEKKVALEDIAEQAFEVHEFVRCKYRNLRTRSSEIDLVCEMVGSSGGDFLREYGRYFLVECKNWRCPVGAKEIRDFLGKLRKTRTLLGIFFSRSGITGEQGGTDALREIHSAYDYDGTCIVVVSGADLIALKKFSDVLGIVETKLDAVRFDL